MKITCETTERTDEQGFTRTAIVVDPSAQIDLVNFRGEFIGRVLVLFPEVDVAEVIVATGEARNAPRTSSVFKFRR